LDASVSYVMNGKIRVSQTSVYLDANVFIEMWENRGAPESKLVWEMFTRGHSKGWRFVSSELSLAEVLVKPILDAKQTGDWQLVNAYRFHIDDKGLFQRIAPVSRDILDMAANVRSENKAIKLPDAIHLSTALVEKCSVFVSNDTRFAEAIKKALYPTPFTAVVTFADLAELDNVL
jgi:predicted nucleic acid-binding protein